MTPIINTTLNNAHYKIACMGRSTLAKTLKKRYNNLALSLLPQIRKKVATKFNKSTEINFVLLMGSASAFGHYNDLDLAVGINKKIGTLPIKDKRFSVTATDESKNIIKKTAEVFYYGSGKINKKYFIRFLHSKPVLFGSIVNPYKKTLTNLLQYAVNEAVKDKFNDTLNDDKKTNLEKHIKASHMLVSACRHYLNLLDPTGRNLPRNFIKTVKDLYGLEIYLNNIKEAKDPYLSSETCITTDKLLHLQKTISRWPK